MDALTETLIYIFGLIALGYGAGRSGILKAETGEGVADFVFVVAIPVLLFKTMATADFGIAAPWAVWSAYFTAVLVTWIAGHFAIRKIFKRDARAGVVAGVSTSFANLVLLGIPFIMSLFGPDGFAVLTLIISIHLAIMMAASVILFEWAERADNVRDGAINFGAVAFGFVQKIITNPLLIGIALGLLLRFSGLTVPAPLFRIVDSLAAVAGPVALFAIGLGLVRFGIAGNVKSALVVAGLKLVLMPAVALGMALLVGLPPLAAKVVVMGAALPSGINPYLIATRFGTGQALASNATTLGTLMAIATTPIWLIIVTLIYGG